MGMQKTSGLLPDLRASIEKALKRFGGRWLRPALDHRVAAGRSLLWVRVPLPRQQRSASAGVPPAPQAQEY